MSHTTLPLALHNFTMSRRGILAAIPATVVLAACAPEPGSLGDEAFSSATGSDKTIDHSAWDALLREYVVDDGNGLNLVKYEQMKAEAADQLTAYLTAMQAVPIEEFSRDEQFAFWVNLYNAVTIDLILDAYPVDTIRDLGILTTGPWKDDVVSVAGRVLSLDNIEHDILRPDWKDVRIHYAVNCASIGCPNLAAQAYTADKLEPMLDAAAAAFINHPRGFGGTPDNIVASSIFDWYQDDWGTAGDVLDHARLFATGSTAELLADATAIDSYDYNWSLNKA